MRTRSAKSPPGEGRRLGDGRAHQVGAQEQARAVLSRPRVHAEAVLLEALRLPSSGALISARARRAAP